MTLLALDAIGHAFLGRFVLEHVSLAVAAGEMVALVGPSGCGKSTLMHIAADLVDPTAGTVTRRYRRHAAVFQEPRLLHWATARANIAVGLARRGLGRRAGNDAVEAAAARVALTSDDLDKYPVQLSGGMRQRVAIARALVAEPDFLYFDEPFSALDVALKRRMQDIVVDTVAGRGLTGLFITHDLAEAVRIAHRVAVLATDGKGLVGDRVIARPFAERDDAFVYATVLDMLGRDPLFRHINDVDERALP
jgi:NitT/TauT family transport system ATP-binding protein